MNAIDGINPATIGGGSSTDETMKGEGFSKVKAKRWNRKVARTPPSQSHPQPPVGRRTHDVLVYKMWQIFHPFPTGQEET